MRRQQLVNLLGKLAIAVEIAVKKGDKEVSSIHRRIDVIAKRLTRLEKEYNVEKENEERENEYEYFHWDTRD